MLNEAKNIGDAVAPARLFNEMQDKISRSQPINEFLNNFGNRVDFLKHLIETTQMYKIYINDKPLFLQDFSQYKLGDALHLSGVYMNKPVTLLQYIDSLEKTNKLESINIYAKDLERLKEDFFGMYEIVDAAGGLVLNENNEILVIFRRGSWDMAKGKIDEGETQETAAVREVMEETGITNVTRHELLGTTYHTYLNGKGKRVLKRSFWYKMTTATQALTPQLEEDIVEAKWVNPHEFLTQYRPMYANIRDILQVYLGR